MPTYKSYLAGFILSLLLTAAAFWPVALHVQSHHLAFSHQTLTYYVLVLAVIELFVQLFFFLHLNQKGPDRAFNLMVLLSTAGIILIVVVGSLWIMKHLNYNMTPAQMNQYLLHEEGMRK